MTVTTELSDLELFRELKGPELDRLRSQAEEVALEADAVIFLEGDIADAFYLVLEGKVSIYRGQIGRPTEHLATLTAGEFFGEMGLLAEATRNASARAETGVVLLKLTKDYLLEMLRHHPAIELKLRNTIIRRRNANITGALDLGRRDDVRIRVSRPVVLTLPDGELLPTVLENLSAGGACLRGVRWTGGWASICASAWPPMAGLPCWPCRCGSPGGGGMPWGSPSGVHRRIM
jgi:CRP-like cAMP-binding protein